MRGKELIEYDNPFDVGMTGLLGFSSGYYAMMNCDLLLMIGTDFPYKQFFPKDATVVQIEVRDEQPARRTKVDYGLVGDTSATLAALLPRLKQNENETHLEKSLELLTDPAARSASAASSASNPIKNGSKNISTNY
jgi:pyruvate dehydrogenase (quinone)